jgi:hypothetical protein
MLRSLIRGAQVAAGEPNNSLKENEKRRIEKAVRNARRCVLPRESGAGFSVSYAVPYR